MEKIKEKPVGSILELQGVMCEVYEYYDLDDGLSKCGYCFMNDSCQLDDYKALACGKTSCSSDFRKDEQSVYYRAVGVV